MVPPRHLHEILARYVHQCKAASVADVGGEAGDFEPTRLVGRLVVPPRHRALHRQHLRHVEALVYLPVGVHAHLELGAEHVPEVFSHGSQSGVPDAGDLSHLVFPRRALLRAFVRGFVSLGAFLGGFFVRLVRGFIRGFALAFVFLLRRFTLARALAFLRLVEPGAIALAHRHHDG